MTPNPISQNPKPLADEIRYHYGALQEKFAMMRQSDPRYAFVPGVPTNKDLPEGNRHTVTVIDDLMQEVSQSTTTTDIFTKYSHRAYISKIFIVQMLYGDSRNARVISDNAHIIVLFKNPQDNRHRMTQAHKKAKRLRCKPKYGLGRT